MGEFKVGDEVVVVVSDAMTFGDYTSGDRARILVLEPSGAQVEWLTNFAGANEEGRCTWLATREMELVKPAISQVEGKLLEPFLQFAMDLCFKNGYEVSNAIESALKLQEASE